MPTRDTAWPTGTPCWVDCQVDDPAAARDFYSALFGWQIDDAPAEAGGYLMAMKDGRAAAGIGPKPEGMPMPSVWSTYFATDDVDATAVAAEEAGAHAWMPPFDVMDVGRMTFLGDPTGAAFGLWQAKSHNGVGVFNEPGALCWNELHTSDYELSQAFYGQVFGYTLTEIGDENFTYSTFSLPGTGPDAAVGGISHDTNKPDGMPNYWLTWFAVADCDASVATASSHGAQVIMPPSDSPFGRMSVVQGPQGEVFGLIAMPTAAAG